MEQINIYGISISNFTIRDAVILMDIFAVHYKAVVISLYEETLISAKKAEELLALDNETIENEINITGIADRWNRNGNDIIELGSLKEKLVFNERKGLITDDRAASDRERINELIKIFRNAGQFEEREVVCTLDPDFIIQILSISLKNGKTTAYTL